MRIAIMTAAAAFALATAAPAAEPTRDDFEATTVASLARLCGADGSSDIGKYALGFCYGWIEGVEQFYAEMLRDARFNVKPISCPGRVVSREETRKIFLEWVRANPDAANMAPIDGIIQASRETFPCP